MKTPPEWNLMVSLCKSSISGVTQHSIDIPKGIKWDVLYELVATHRVFPLVHDALSDPNSKIYPPEEIMAKIKRKKQSIVFQNLLLSKELIRLHKILNDAKIPYIPYKGVILAQQVYQEIGARQTADLDIFINPTDIDKLKEVLKANGYQVPSRLSPVLKKQLIKNDCEIQITKRTLNRTISIDAHWSVGNAMLQLNVGYKELSRYCESEKLFGEEINCIQPEALLVLTCMHHCGKEDLIQLKQITDLAKILLAYSDEFDWDKLITIATNWKVFKMVLFAIDLVNKVYEIQISKSIIPLMDQYNINALNSRHMDRLINSKGKIYIGSIRNFIDRFKFQLSLRERRTTRLKMILYHALQIVTPNNNDFPNPEKVTIWNWYLTFITKPLRLFKSYVMPSH